MPKDTITIELSSDEAVVLFEFLQRMESDNRLAFANPAEFIALLRISGQLESNLLEPFDPNYRQILHAAQNALAADFNSDYPGPRCSPA